MTSTAVDRRGSICVVPLYEPPKTSSLAGSLVKSIVHTAGKVQHVMVGGDSAAHHNGSSSTKKKKQSTEAAPFVPESFESRPSMDDDPRWSSKFDSRITRPKRSSSPVPPVNTSSQREDSLKNHQQLQPQAQQLQRTSLTPPRTSQGYGGRSDKLKYLMNSSSHSSRPTRNSNVNNELSQSCHSKIETTTSRLTVRKTLSPAVFGRGDTDLTADSSESSSLDAAEAKPVRKSLGTKQRSCQNFMRPTSRKAAAAKAAATVEDTKPEKSTSTRQKRQSDKKKELQQRSLTPPPPDFGSRHGEAKEELRRILTPPTSSSKDTQLTSQRGQTRTEPRRSMTPPPPSQTEPTSRQSKEQRRSLTPPRPTEHQSRSSLTPPTSATKSSRSRDESLSSRSKDKSPVTAAAKEDKREPSKSSKPPRSSKDTSSSLSTKRPGRKSTRSPPPRELPSRRRTSSVPKQKALFNAILSTPTHRKLDVVKKMDVHDMFLDFSDPQFSPIPTSNKKTSPAAIDYGYGDIYGYGDTHSNNYNNNYDDNVMSRRRSVSLSASDRPVRRSSIQMQGVVASSASALRRPSIRR